MKIRMTIEVNDGIREAINFRLGRSGKASRDEVITEIETILGGHWEHYVYEREHGDATVDETL